MKGKLENMQKGCKKRWTPVQRHEITRKLKLDFDKNSRDE